MGAVAVKRGRGGRPAASRASRRNASAARAALPAPTPAALPVPAEVPAAPDGRSATCAPPRVWRGPLAAGSATEQDGGPEFPRAADEIHGPGCPRSSEDDRGQGYPRAADGPRSVDADALLPPEAQAPPALGPEGVARMKELLRRALDSGTIRLDKGPGGWSVDVLSLRGGEAVQPQWPGGAAADRRAGGGLGTARGALPCLLLWLADEGLVDSRVLAGLGHDAAGVERLRAAHADELAELAQLDAAGSFLPQRMLARLVRGRMAQMTLAAATPLDMARLSRAVKHLPEWVWTLGEAAGAGPSARPQAAGSVGPHSVRPRKAEGAGPSARPPATVPEASSGGHCAAGEGFRGQAEGASPSASPQAEIARTGLAAAALQPRLESMLLQLRHLARARGWRKARM